MKLRQGTFSFLPDLDDTQIHQQVQYCIDNGWAVSLEYTDDPHPRNTYWAPKPAKKTSKNYHTHNTH